MIFYVVNIFRQNHSRKKSLSLSLSHRSPASLGVFLLHCNMYRVV